jgi:hypothetical protein
MIWHKTALPPQLSLLVHAGWLATHRHERTRRERIHQTNITHLDGAFPICELHFLLSDTIIASCA